MRSMFLRPIDKHYKKRMQELVNKWQPIRLVECAACGVEFVVDNETEDGKLFNGSQMIGYKFDDNTLLCSACYYVLKEHFDKYLDSRSN